jgi:hypothetical protein
MVKVIQQHGNAGQGFFILIQAAQEGDKALHPLGFQPVAFAQPRLEQGCRALRDNRLYIFFRWQRSLFQVNFEAFTDAGQLGSL